MDYFLIQDEETNFKNFHIPKTEDNHKKSLIDFPLEQNLTHLYSS